MNILHVSSEISPFSKTGGLGDMTGALSRALAAVGRDSGDHVAVIVPAYRVDADHFGLARRLRRINVKVGAFEHEVEVLEGHLPGGGGEVRAFLVDHEVFRRGGLYGEQGHDYPDNAFRFALFCHAAVLVPPALGFVPDVIHAHDWQAGPSLHYARRGELRNAKTILTIHNLAFQGLFPLDVAPAVDFAEETLTSDGAEFFGQLSYLKAGLCSADRITTVSPRYAREIVTDEYGCGLDGLLRARGARLSGILNGVDYDLWNPQRDPFCAAPYDPVTLDGLDGKQACKAALQRSMKLPVRPRVPLIGAVSRITDQKGFDLAIDVLERLLEAREVQIAIVGTGEQKLEAGLRALAARHPSRMAVRITYDEELAHCVYAGSDLYLMPSRYEPCGLSQMYALRYGAVPIVRATGGLEDSVVDYDPYSQSGTGFKFIPATATALEASVQRALDAYATDENFPALMRRGMLQNFSCLESARSYRALYEEA